MSIRSLSVAKKTMTLRTRYLAVLCLLAPLPATADETVFVSGFDPVWVLGYHVGYEADDLPTASIDFAAMTHVVIGAVKPHTDATLDTTYDIDTVNGPIWAKGVADAAHTAGRKALLMIGGAGNENIAGFRGAATPANRAAFVTNLLAVVDAVGANGLDLDWEPLEPGDYGNFTALAQALRTARPALTLTVPVGAINTNMVSEPDPFFGNIAPLFDRIDIMTYDMEYDQFGWNSWFTSALKDQTDSTPESVETSVAFYIASGVPRSKLGIGIGFYGVCWKGVTGPRQVVPAGDGIVGGDNSYSYHNIVTQYFSLANYHYDMSAESAYLGSESLFGPPVRAKCNFLSYEDATSIAAKGAWSNRHGLGGTIIWNIGEGYVPEEVGAENALLEAVHEAFLPGEP